MNAQTLFLIINDILQSILAIGLTLYKIEANNITLTYAISPFVIVSIVIRIVYLKLKKSHPYLNTLAVAIYFSKIMLVWIAEQKSASILKLQLAMDIIVFLNQKNKIQNINIILWMISILVTIDNLKFDGNFEKYIWRLVCEILLILIDIIISIEISRKKDNNQPKEALHPSQIHYYNRQYNLSALFPVQEISKQLQSDGQIKQTSLQINPTNHMFQEQYLIFNQNYAIKSTDIQLSQYLINKNIRDNCFLLFLSIPVIYFTNAQEQKTTIKEYIDNNIEQQHYYQAFSVLKNSFFDFQGKIFSLSKQKCQSENEYVIHFFQAPYEQNQDEQHMVEICKSLSHELGTNLNSIQTFSDMGMSDDSVPLDIKQKYFKPILINSEQLTFILSNLRDFQLLTLKQFNIKIEEFDLIEELNKVDALFQDAFANKNLEFIRELQGDSTSFYNDKQRFLQVYFQLLQNAVKFTQEGQIKVIIEKKQKHCEITIIDTGIGLNENEQKNLKILFESNGSLKISKNSVGSGLGLRIANSLANKMNGNMSNIQYLALKKGSAFSFIIRNYQQKYTKSFTFKMLTVNMESQSNQNIFVKRISCLNSIRQLSASLYIESSISLKSKKSFIPQSLSQFCELPTFKIQEPSNSQIEFDSMMIEDKLNPPHLSPKFKDSITQFSIKSKCCSRVLVVDDEFFNIQCIKVIMELQYQAICSTAYNGVEAISLIQQKLKNPCKICQNNSFQIIFLDINMPIMDGFEAVKYIKELQHKRVISKNWCIANTGFCDLETKMKSYDAGMDFYLTKPLDRKLLNEIIITLFPK